MNDARAHLVHVVHRLDTGGMENGLVNLVNRLPAGRFRHTIVPLTEVGGIATRITNPEVCIEPLRLSPGPLARALPKLWSIFRRLAPAIVHTRNVGTLEAQIAAVLAGVPVRIHGEHGWEVHDLVGSNASLLRTRRLLRSFVHAQVALSVPTFEYLRDRVGVPVIRLRSIHNGVDTSHFAPFAANESTAAVGVNGDHAGRKPIVIGYIGRLAAVKNPLVLVDAFEVLHHRVELGDSELARRLRLRIIGDGPLSVALARRITGSTLRHAIELLGHRDDIADCMRALDIYALPSLAEGISNTLLEAMACALPCVATDVGGNRELIEHGACGTLVPANDSKALAQALERYAREADVRELHGQRARTRAIEHFGIDRMIAEYERLYTDLLLDHHVMKPQWATSADDPPALARTGSN